MGRPRSRAVATIGTPVRRREDYRFLTGGGTYTDDINRPGQLYAYILRSSHAHARITAIDASAATRAPGVVAIYIGADMAADGVGGLPCGWQVHSKDGSPMAEPPHPVLAVDRVRHVGDPVAVVIGDNLAQARDAAELVSVDYREEPAVVDPVEALKPGAPQVRDEAPGNLCYDWHLGDLAAVDAAIGKAARVVKLARDGEAKFLALKVSTIANIGAYLSTFAPCIPTYLYGTLLAGTYTTPAIYCETKAVFTHTVPVDAYRGAGRPEATFLLERIVDVAADELGIDPVELRRKNFIPADAFPYPTPVALQYDSGDYETTLRMALEAADYAGFEARR